MYTQTQKQLALQMYDETKSATKVIQRLGYPTRQNLYQWIKKRTTAPVVKKKTRGLNTPDHPRHAPYHLKIEIIHRCFELGEDVKLVSEETGYSRPSIYAWRRKYIQKGGVSLMNNKDIPRGKLQEGKLEEKDKRVESFVLQVQEMRLEMEILKETINVLKKDLGIDAIKLKNNEKAIIIDALKNVFPLPSLLKKLEMPRSCY